MDATDYWLMAREYSIWNAAIASLQFWTADLDPVTLGRATEQVYSTFFYSSSSYTLCQQSEKILFGSCRRLVFSGTVHWFLKEDKLSSTIVDFIRSEGNLKTKRLYWIRRPKKC